MGCSRYSLPFSARIILIRFISDLFLDRSVIRVNLFLLVLCLLFGFTIYAGTIHGVGDDMNNLAATVGNGSSWEYIKWYYLNWGQTGIVIWLVPVQLAIKIFHITPEVFPWWFFASINTFNYLAAVYMLVMGGKSLLKYGWQEALFLLAFTYGVWLTPIVYKSTIDIPVTFFSAFTLPTYLLTIAVYWFSANDFGKKIIDWLALGCIYLLLSINTETFLLSIPIIFTGITVIQAIQDNYRPKIIFRIIGFFATLSLISALFIWTQPGFHIRPVSLNFHIPSFLEIAQWYVSTLEDIGFKILIENPFYIHLVRFVRYILPLLLFEILFGLWMRHKKKIQFSSQPEIVLLLTKSMWALVLISGFLFCMVPLLFTGYFPDYVKVYPSLLMAGGLSFCISVLIHIFKPATVSELLAVFGKPSLVNGELMRSVRINKIQGFIHSKFFHCFFIILWMLSCVAALLLTLHINNLLVLYWVQLPVVTQNIKPGKQGGNIYVISIKPGWLPRSKGYDLPTRLYENERSLAPGNALRTEIGTLGDGRYTYENGRLFFSTSDNSDPRMNGRRYTLELPFIVASRCLKWCWVIVGLLSLAMCIRCFKGYHSCWLWLKWIAVVTFLCLIFSFNTLLHFNGIYKAFQAELIKSAIRQDFQQKIEVAYHKTGQKVYIVAGCPKGIMVEQFWGISGYFYWKGVDDIFGVLDTDPNLGGLSPQEEWPDKKSWYKIDCLKITSKQLEILQP